jgi:hypothetical protein
MNRPFHALLLSAALAACAATTPMHWEKPGASQAGLKEDTEQCRAQARFARLPERVTAPPPRSTAERALTREEELAAQETASFQACMRDKGYGAKR